MNEMMERIANVIHKYKFIYDEYPLAREIIKAMREPTDAMIVAGVHHDNMGDMAGRWRAMIDAALLVREGSAAAEGICPTCGEATVPGRPTCGDAMCEREEPIPKEKA